MTTRIKPFKTQQEVRNLFDDKLKLCPRPKNEFINLYFKNQNRDLFVVRLDWENPDPTKWYVDLFYDRDNFPEMFNLLTSDAGYNANNTNNNQGVLTIEIDIGYDYPFRPPKMTLIVSNYHIGETPIKNGKIKCDGSIENHFIREISYDELLQEFAAKRLDPNDPQNWNKVQSWCPRINLNEIIEDLYIEIATCYHRYGRLMFFQ